MVKVSRPIIYTILAGAAIYAVVLFTEPEAPARKPAARTAASASRTAADSSGITEEDLKAEFPRYAPAPTPRDPFRPGVAPKNSRGGGSGGGSGTSAVVVDPRLLPPGSGLPGSQITQKWTLTGISSVNGVRSALVENGRREDSVFLKAGDQWNGLRVAAVESDAIIFVNNLGQRTRLTFIVTVPETRGSGTTPGGPARPPTATAQNNRSTGNVPN